MFTTLYQKFQLKGVRYFEGQSPDASEPFPRSENSIRLKFSLNYKIYCLTRIVSSILCPNIVEVNTCGTGIHICILIEF